MNSVREKKGKGKRKKDGCCGFKKKRQGIFLFLFFSLVMRTNMTVEGCVVVQSYVICIVRCLYMLKLAFFPCVPVSFFFFFHFFLWSIFVLTYSCLDCCCSLAINRQFFFVCVLLFHFLFLLLPFFSFLSFLCVMCERCTLLFLVPCLLLLCLVLFVLFFSAVSFFCCCCCCCLFVFVVCQQKGKKSLINK